MLNFRIEKRMPNALGRVGVLEVSHGVINTPAFATVGTKATVKSLTPEQIKELGSEVVLANTYHLYLEPGEKMIEKAGGLNQYMHWDGPTMTDSGGFQVFSLGSAYKKGITKIAKGEDEFIENHDDIKLAKIDDDGVSFKSPIDGKEHHLTPEKSIQIQHSFGADIIFAFDECTSPHASYEYQIESLRRTHTWAKRSIDEHKKLGGAQALFGIVQGGRFADLREESAKEINKMGFDGFGIGGSFTKDDIDSAVGLVCKNLDENKPRHLLGIGEPEDIFKGVENGIDTFDCVAPTRTARNGSLYTREGRINISNAKYREDFTPIDKDCGCYTCKNYTKSYLSHLFRAKEILANTLASIHNLYFIVHLLKDIRESILNDKFENFKKDFLQKYYNK
ncbi:MAG: tRNA guanosine(34) transglycosylase Tgt [Patescibacteria group bacterium]